MADAEDLREIATDLASFAEWVRGDYAYVEVAITRDVDFGELGEREFTLADDSYEVDPQRVIAQASGGSITEIDDFDNIIDLVRIAADRMDELSKERELSVEDHLREAAFKLNAAGNSSVATLVEAMASMVGVVAITPICAEPVVVVEGPSYWPGSNSGVDFSGAGIEERMDPPPGWVWSNEAWSTLDVPELVKPGEKPGIYLTLEGLIHYDPSGVVNTGCCTACDEVIGQPRLFHEGRNDRHGNYIPADAGMNGGETRAVDPDPHYAVSAPPMAEGSSNGEIGNGTKPGDAAPSFEMPAEVTM